jgi:hypothetical protein
MKSLIKAIVLALVATVLSTTVLTAKTPPAINSTHDLEKAIKIAIDFPEVEGNDFECQSVNIIFKIDFDGSIKVVKTEGCDKLCQKVCKSLEKLSIEEASMYGRFFSKKITFKLIK